MRAFFDPDCLQEDIRSSFHFDAFALRATGVREGTDFRFSRLEYVDRDDFADLHFSGSFTVSWLVERYDLPWRLLYENPDASRRAKRRKCSTPTGQTSAICPILLASLWTVSTMLPWRISSPKKRRG